MRAANRYLLLAGTVLFALVACTEPTSSRTPSLDVRLGKAASGPTVTAATPSSAAQNSTLDVQISGSGFDAGSSAQWLLNGTPDSRVRTNSTRYVSSTSLVANITVAQDAVPAAYDVAVTAASGKKGIGTEKFTVLAMEQLSSPDGASGAHDVNTLGVIAGSTPGGCDGYTIPVLWVNGIVKALPVPAGLCRGRAWRINEAGEVLGQMYPAGATSLTQSIPLLWKPVGDGFTVQELGLASGVRPYDILDFNESAHAVVNISIREAYWWSEASGYVRLANPPNSTGCYADGVNDLDEIVGECWMNDITAGKNIATTVFWSSPTSAPAILPRLAGYNYAHEPADLNNLGVAVGQALNTKGSTITETGVRYLRNGTGVWTIEILPDLGAGGTDPRDINDDGWIIGRSNITSARRHAFLWRQGQQMKDLGAVGPESWADGVTPVGASELLVVGQTTSGKVNRAVLWRPQL